MTKYDKYEPNTSVPSHLRELAILLRLDVVAARSHAGVWSIETADGKTVYLGPIDAIRHEGMLNFALRHLDGREDFTVEHRDAGRVAAILTRLGAEHEQEARQ